MANVKISQLPVATTIAPTDVLLVVQGGVTKQVTHDVVAAAVAASAAVSGTYLTLPTGTKTTGYAPVVQANGSIAWSAVSAGGNGLSASDAGNGSGVLTSTGSGTVTDNGNGSGTLAA